MNEATTRVFLILASARVLMRDMDEFFDYISGADRDEFLRQFSRTKVALRRFEEALESDSSDSEQISARPMTAGGSRFDITRRDVNYIIKRAGWSNPEAAERIAMELSHMGVASSDDIIRYNPKEGFQRWLRRLYNSIGPQTLLRAVATAAQSASGSSPAWKLKS